jgi:hypothetical protein
MVFDISENSLSDLNIRQFADLVKDFHGFRQIIMQKVRPIG